MATQARQPTRLTNAPTANRQWLEEISRNAKPRPTAAVLYGPPGVGKTTIAASMVKPVFLIDDKEDGINTLRSTGLVDEVPVLPPAENWLDAMGMLDALIAGEHDYKTLVIDTIGGLERHCHQFVCETQFNGEWGDKGFASYHKGYDVSLPVWREFLNRLDRLRSDKAMGVMLLAHSIIKPFKNPLGEDYDRYIPDVHHKTWATTHKWADMVLFCNYEVETTKEGGRAKGRGGHIRIMHTEYDAAWEAKNRFNLPPEIDMGNSGKEAWANLIQAMKEGRK